MKYFVTGATGFVGNALTRLLIASGHQVHASVRSPAKAGDLATLGVKLYAGDVTDKESMRSAMSGVDGVFHVAGWYKIGTRDQRDGERVNIQGTRNVLELMKELGIRKGVYTSTLAVNSDTGGRLVDENYHFTGKHLSEYDRTKAVAHDIAKHMIAGGLPLVIVMPGMVYGPGDTSSLRVSILQYLQQKLPVLPRQTALCWAHVDDIARGHLLAMEKGKTGETYIIAGEPYELAKAFDLAQELTGIPAPAKISPGMLSLTSKMIGPLEKFLPLPEAYTAEGLRIVAGVTYIGDNSKARRELGYAPRPLRDGWKATLEHELSILGLK
jgi:nucleoside-diphosphate-sugar epimerase